MIVAEQDSSNRTRMTMKLLFMLLPVQVLLASIGAVNGIVSSFFASNFIGDDAMSAVGYYSPINQLISAISIMFVTGSTILCGKYIGGNQVRKMRNVFTLDMILSGIVSGILTLIVTLMPLLGATRLMTPDPDAIAALDPFMLGQALGIIPFMLGSQLSSFLSLENRMKRTMVASLSYIVINLALCFLFVQVLSFGPLGLALANSIGMWAFFLIPAAYFLSGKSELRLVRKGLEWRESLDIVKIGAAGAITNAYVAIRGFIVNGIISAYVGSAGISAFAASGAMLALFWAIPTGMQAVSRMMISIGVGEEDKNTLTDVMKTALFRFVPLMCAVSAMLILAAVPLTMVFFRNPADPVYDMTVWAYRILPLCMPLSVICMHFVCYGMASNKQGFVHVMALLDGVICVSSFSALLVPQIGMNGVYIANVLNGVVTTIVIVLYAILKKRGVPKNMEELMVIPADFGVKEEERLDFAVSGMEDVIGISEQVQSFCLDRGIDKRRSMYASLSLEEMAGNVVKHGFEKEEKPRHAFVRAIHKNDDVILCIKDDCRAFDPVARYRLADQNDRTANIGLRIVTGMAKDVNYQNILGLNVLNIKI